MGDNKYRIIIGDRNRSRIRQYKEDHFTDDEEMYRYIPPSSSSSMEWNSPEEETLMDNNNNTTIQFTLKKMFQSDMWRLGMIIYYCITGGDIYNDNTTDRNSMFDHDSILPWCSLSYSLLIKDYLLRLTSKGLLHHPVFWYFLSSKVSEFYKQICRSPLDSSSLLSNEDLEKFLHPHTNWISVIFPDDNNTSNTATNNLINQQFVDQQNGTSIMRLLRLIIDVITPHPSQLKDEYCKATLLLCNQRNINPISFFQKHFPYLLFTIWEIFFNKKKQLEVHQLAVSDILSC